MIGSYRFVSRIEYGVCMRAIWVGLVGIVLLGLVGWAAYQLRPRTLLSRPAPLIPVCEQSGGRSVVTLSSRLLVAYLAHYDDELYAYRMYTYLRGSPAFRDSEVLLTFRKSSDVIVYDIQARLANDLLSSLDLLAHATTSGLISDYDWRFVNLDTYRTLQYQTHLFDLAYNLPIQQKLESLTRPELEDYIRRFTTFKSATTDRRVQASLELAPKPLTPPEASQLAADIVAVSDFYSLPLDFFLGIGAMENNYMNVKGDLSHAIWKRRADRGDVVLKRRRAEVLVLNEASGWQITRETLRYAHQLYRNDTRDYSQLPPALRPPRELNPDDVDPEVLTTYAGLLFRDLLDRLHGDVARAVGAYNGGPGNPNPRYEEGVRMVADYARRVMEHAVALNGRPAAGATFHKYAAPLDF
jgi:hypothetical protein